MTGVAEIERPDAPGRRDPRRRGRPDDGGLRVAEREVVFQATFFDGSFVGFADFIVRLPDGRYRVQDSKLARSARVTALLQLAAYAEQLRAAWESPIDDTVELLLGDGSVSDAPRVATSSRCTASAGPACWRSSTSIWPTPAPVAWGDPRFTVCGRCDTCDAEIQAARDVLLVAGMRVDAARATARRRASRTIDALAASTRPRRRHRRGHAGRRSASRRALQVEARPGAPPPVRVFNAPVLAVLPAARRGRHLLRLRGRPAVHRGRGGALGARLPVRPGRPGRAVHRLLGARLRRRAAGAGGLPRLRPRAAAAQYPGMHIYHYAAYEQTHLLALAARHGVGEEEVDELLREDVLRRPLPARPQGGARRVALVLDQEARAALHGRRTARRAR